MCVCVCVCGGGYHLTFKINDSLCFSYYMYFHRIMTALAFICIFSAIEFIFATIAWKGIGEHLWRKLSQSFKYHEHAVVASRSDLLDNVSNKSDSI